MSESKATKKVIEVKQFVGLKEFEIIKDHPNHKKGSKVELTYEIYCIFKKLKLVK